MFSSRSSLKLMYCRLMHGLFDAPTSFNFVAWLKILTSIAFTWFPSILRLVNDLKFVKDLESSWLTLQDLRLKRFKLFEPIALFGISTKLLSSTVRSSRLTRVWSNSTGQTVSELLEMSMVLIDGLSIKIVGGIEDSRVSSWWKFQDFEEISMHSIRSASKDYF